jgi:drug/metabolite transporter (DMT)-like permease
MMRASTLMLIAAALYVVHRWATNQKAVDGQVIVEAAFAILVIAMLDQGRTEPIATGFAWLFLIGAAYVAIPSIAKAAGTTTTTAKTTTTAPQGVTAI